MKKIAVITSTRAEFGLLAPVIKELRTFENECLKVFLVVTGTHLSKEYGSTINEIEDRIDYQIEIPIRSESEEDISANQADALVKFTKLFCSEQFDAVILLGDRYETLAIAIAAGNTRTPIFHMCGGDTTEGAMDEWIRHSITKISYLHFVTNEDSRKRVIQLGEDPIRVFNYGSTSIDNIVKIADLSKEEVMKSIGLEQCKYAICTYHPVTMEKGNVECQINELLEAIKAFPEIVFIFTKSNADQGGARINKILDEAENSIENLRVFTSLGAKRYLSLMRYSEFVIGNSSSGIIEAPAFKIPTINIGDRQKGRLQSHSIINCENTASEIMAAIKLAMSLEFKGKCKSVVSAYGSGNASKQIADRAIKTIQAGNIELKKHFFDLKETEI